MVVSHEKKNVCYKGNLFPFFSYLFIDLTREELKSIPKDRVSDLFTRA